MKPLPHERRRWAGALRWLRDELPAMKPSVQVMPKGWYGDQWSESPVDKLHEPETKDALRWAIEELESDQ